MISCSSKSCYPLASVLSDKQEKNMLKYNSQRICFTCYKFLQPLSKILHATKVTKSWKLTLKCCSARFLADGPKSAQMSLALQTDGENSKCLIQSMRATS